MRKEYASLVRIPELDDIYVMSVADLRKNLAAVARRHGKNALIRFDAGYNNITVELVEERVIRRRR